MKRFFIITALLLVVMGIGYLLGPSAHHDPIKNATIHLDSNLVKMEQHITESERKAKLRPDNQARIV